MHFPPVSDFPLFPKILFKLRGNCFVNFTFSKKISRFSYAKISDQIFLVIHSFIHYGDLYSAPSRLLLRNAPDPCTAKEKRFEARVKCFRKNPGEKSLRKRKPIRQRGANHRECPGLGCGGTSKRNKE